MRSPVRTLTSYSRDDHRRRLLAIERTERDVGACGRRHLILDYLPGQASYQIGDYPSLTPYEVDEYDVTELERLAAAGVELIQIMEDWNDLLGLHGADKFTSPNPEGLRRFIDAAHQVGIRVLLYVSTGYMQAGDPALDLDWTRESVPEQVQALHWKLMRCSPASPGWRSFLLSKVEQVLGDWDIDGIYDDWGHTPPLASNPLPLAKDEILAWRESATHDAAKEDLLATVYERLRSDGKIFKLHADFNNAPLSELRLYDYLWVGEGIGNLNKTLDETKWHRPYVVPAFDTRWGGVPEEHKYLYSIPYMQFPQLFAGKPLTGERAIVPGIDYREDDPLYASVMEYRHAWLAGRITTPAYSCWDMSLEVEPRTRAIFSELLAIYRQMTQAGTRAYLEVTRTNLLNAPIPDDVVLSVFANVETYLVLANYGDQEREVTTSAEAIDTRNPSEPSHRTWTLPPKSMLILREVAPQEIA
jgi:hypothetical protein